MDQITESTPAAAASLLKITEALRRVMALKEKIVQDGDAAVARSLASAADRLLVVAAHVEGKPEAELTREIDNDLSRRMLALLEPNPLPIPLAGTQTGRIQTKTPNRSASPKSREGELKKPDPSGSDTYK